MTEAEWLACTDDTNKLHWKLEYLLDKVSERKFHLFRIACCRRLWHLLVRDRYRHAVEVAERFIEGQSSKEELESVVALAYDMLSEERKAKSSANDDHQMRELGVFRASLTAVDAAACDHTFFSLPNTASYAYAIHWKVFDAGGIVAGVDACWPKEASSPSDDWAIVIMKSQKAETLLHDILLHDIFRNPFRRITISPEWLTPNVVALAQAIYDERAFDRLPELADALVDTGCENHDILNHCRSEGPHVRGCWAVDLVLGKK